MFARLCALSICLGFSSLAAAGNWPSWRGPTQNGVCAETGVPLKWSATTNVAWKLPLPGPAGATPVVWGKRIFLTTIDGDALVLMCVGTDGKPQWKQTLGSGNKRARGDEGNSASPSPVTDGKQVWVMFGTGSIGCFTVEGKPVWKFNLQERFGRFRIQFGMSSTPVLAGGRLFVQLIHGDGKARTQEALVAALDASNGKTVWKRDRVTAAYAENEHSYASPILYDDGEQQYLITHGADYTIAYKLDDGSIHWKLGGLNPQDDPSRRYHPTLRFVASPAANEGLVVIPTAKNQRVFAVAGDSTGDITGSKSAIKWTLPDNTPDVPSPLIKDGLVYLCRENGNLLCVEAATGKIVYNKRTHRNRHRASPVWVEGRVYLTSRDGKITVVKAGREFEILAQNDIGDTIAASPAIADGTIYLRSFGALWAIRAK